MKSRTKKLTPADVHRFEKSEAQIQGLYDEIDQLTRKRPNDAVNKFKLRLVNQAIELGNEILTEQYKPFPDFSRFAEDELPSNSDVALMLSQYLISLENLRSDNVEVDDDHDWRWIVAGDVHMPTKEPKKYRTN
jgi:hypothetical protein